MNAITWSDDQRTALDALKSGRSAFITGGAGTGKSTVTKQFCHGRNVAKLATTGAASVLIRGQTAHSFFGMRPQVHVPGSVRDGKVEVSSKALRRMASFDGILIDEVSMLRIDMFQCIIETMGLAKTMRGGKPFQLICVGDFAQLPPVVTEEERRVLRDMYGSAMFAFEHAAWSALDTHELSVIHRQSADSDYAKWLAGVRHGHVPDVNLVNSRVGAAPEDSVRLVATNAAAARINDEKMNALPGRDVILRGKLRGDFNPSNVRVPEAFPMRRGARVIICKNNKQAGYVNGSTGLIMEIGYSNKGKLLAKILLDSGKTVQVTEGVWEQISYERSPTGDYEAKVRGTYTQMPLLPGWAITIHRSQGMSLDSVHADPQGLFTSGQAYVALSRATSLEGLTLESPVDREDLYPHPKVARYHESLLKGQEAEALPFTL